MKRVREFWFFSILGSVLFLLGCHFGGQAIAATDGTAPMLSVASIIVLAVAAASFSLALSRRDVLEYQDEEVQASWLEIDEMHRQEFLRELQEGRRQPPVRCMAIKEGEPTQPLFEES